MEYESTYGEDPARSPSDLLRVSARLRAFHREGR
jgi:hypothetical protein